MKKDISFYLELPYTKIVKTINDESGKYYSGYFLEIPEAKTVGDTLTELDDNLKDVLELSIKIRLENKEVVPEPSSDDYSGKFIVRIPKELHKTLALQAQEQKTSLNQYVLYKLAR